MTSKKTYSQLQTELDEILVELQTAELDIDKAINLYKKGEAVITELEKQLQTAKNTIKHLKI